MPSGGLDMWDCMSEVSLELSDVVHAPLALLPLARKSVRRWLDSVSGGSVV